MALAAVSKSLALSGGTVHGLTPLRQACASLSRSPWLLGCRQLYTPAALGLEQFLMTREKTSLQFTNLQEAFKERMRTLLDSQNTKTVIFTEDLKNAIHLARDSDEDVSLVLEMARGFNKQHKGLRFGSYVFGPVMMRMFHILNRPNTALQALRDEQLQGLFDQLISYQLIMDLLYESGQYAEVLEVFEDVQERRIGGVRYPKNCFTLAIAACYKMNTQESLQKMSELLEGAEEYGLTINRRLLVFCAALALRQGHPHTALELAMRSTSLTHIAIRSIKVMALCDLGKVEETLPALRAIAEVDVPAPPKFNQGLYILREAVSKVEAALKEICKKDQVAEFERILKFLEESGTISEKALDDVVAQPIEQFKKHQDRWQEKAMLAASFNSNQRKPRYQHRPHHRQGLMDME